MCAALGQSLLVIEPGPAAHGPCCPRLLPPHTLLPGPPSRAGSLVPGALVAARVRAVLSDGLLCSFLTFFSGTVDPFHLGVEPGAEWRKQFRCVDGPVRGEE